MAGLRALATRSRRSCGKRLSGSATSRMGSTGRQRSSTTIFMLPADAGETSEGRTAANNATVRTVYIVGPDKLIKAMLIYPMSSGRNFDEVLRLLDSIQLTAKHSVATPVNWKQGEDCIIVPSLSNEDAAAKFPGGWNTLKPYLRTVPQPVDEPQPVD